VDRSRVVQQSGTAGCKVWLAGYCGSKHSIILLSVFKLLSHINRNLFSVIYKNNNFSWPVTVSSHQGRQTKVATPLLSSVQFSLDVRDCDKQMSRISKTLFYIKQPISYHNLPYIRNKHRELIRIHKNHKYMYRTEYS